MLVISRRKPAYTRRVVVSSLYIINPGLIQAISKCALQELTK